MYFTSINVWGYYLEACVTCFLSPINFYPGMWNNANAADHIPRLALYPSCTKQVRRSTFLAEEKCHRHCRVGMASKTVGPTMLTGRGLTQQDDIMMPTMPPHE